MNKIDFDSVNLTQALVRCPSITPEDEGALKIVEDHLSAIGFKCINLKFSEKNYADVKNLFATIGNEGNHLAFAGHTDVVPPGNEKSWKFPPFSGTIENGKLYGRGSEDMKSSIACFISATNKFIKKHSSNFGGKISFIITGDEEKEAVNGTIKIMEWTKKNNYLFDHCIVGEPTSKKIVGDKIKIGRRGSINFFITVKGIQGHTANSHRAENPAHHLIHMLNKILNKPLDEGNEFFLPSSIQIATFDINNSAANIIPETAKATINIRFNNIHTGDSLKKWLQNHIDSVFGNLEKASCSFTTDQTGESFITKPIKLKSIVTKAVREKTGINQDPEMGTDGGTSDARFIKDYCEVIELGIINNTLHQVDEYVNVSDINDLHNIYFCILEKYFNKN
tara:strand:+ start:6970 stop:8151 length:1182 start_codon:yes stop_codon:yes gene_type:complete